MNDIGLGGGTVKTVIFKGFRRICLFRQGAGAVTER